MPVLLTRPVNGTEAGPHPRRADFDSLDAYEQAFWVWRAIHRDGQLTAEESDAALTVALEWVASR